MGHGKETPRQKLIGMMYLVLMALLAINVQKEVLDAFANVDHAITKTIGTFDERNKIVYDDFIMSHAANPIKVGPLAEKAAEVKKMADELYELIFKYKVDIIVATDGPEALALPSNQPEGSHGGHADDHGAAHDDGHGDDHGAGHEGHIDIMLILAKSDMNKPAQIMIGDGTKEMGGDILEKKIDEYREFLMGIIEGHTKGDEKVRKSLESNLNTDAHVGPDGMEHPWKDAHFNHLPVAGVIAIMSGLQADIRNSESEVIRYLHNKIDAGTFKFTGIETMVIANSNYILKGGKYKADIFLSASDSTQDPEVFLGKVDSVKTKEGDWFYFIKGDSTAVKVENGKAKFEREENSLGEKGYEGIIKLKNLDNSYTTRKFSHKYTVAEGSSGVSAKKMNVFYLGVDNPVDVFVGGVQAENIEPVISNGKIKRVGNEWIVNPKSPGNALITIRVKREDGALKDVGFVEFKVKTVPDPVAKINGRKDGGIKKPVLAAQFGIVADMENFDFDLEYKVTGFVVSAVVNGFTQEVVVKGFKFDKKVQQFIQRLPGGRRVTFSGIKAVGPDGTVRNLNSISFKLI
ncbi:hypothetical protein OAO55_00220 [Bacteroidales bacterium]|nr:hypothetical protein [Bacteroidales bacterium]